MMQVARLIFVVFRIDEISVFIIKKHYKSTYLRRQTIPMASIASQIPTAKVTMIMSEVPTMTYESLFYIFHNIHRLYLGKQR